MDAKTKNKLIAAAEEAAENAYCPYSGYAVGAAVLTGSGKVFCGCNVENASYSLTVCAERNAIFRAVGEGEKEIVALCVYSAGDRLPYPCGACRQTLAEFCDDAEIIVAGKDGSKETTLKKLLPSAFR